MAKIGLKFHTLALHRRLHGYEIANAIQQKTDDVLRVEEGSLYPALQRMLGADFGNGQLRRAHDVRDTFGVASPEPSTK